MKYADIEKRAESGDYCFLFRAAIQHDWINREHELNRTVMWMVRFIENPRDQLEAYLCESLACALFHAERDIATRAAFQATAYMARLKENHGWAGGGYWEDSLRAAQGRIERWTFDMAELYNVSGYTFRQWQDYALNVRKGIVMADNDAITAWRAGISPEVYAAGK